MTIRQAVALLQPLSRREEAFITQLEASTARFTHEQGLCLLREEVADCVVEGWRAGFREGVGMFAKAQLLHERGLTNAAEMWPTIQ